MITYKGLIQLGFTSDDFLLQDDSDGNGTYIKEWNSDQPQPSVVDIESAHAVWQTDYDSQQYARDRQYPAIGDQLDMIFHAGLGGDEFQAAIQAVKDANPKP
jgi:hypothetical protein